MSYYGDFPDVWVFPSVAFQESHVTAIGIVGTDHGFIMAADGRMSLDDESKRTASPEMLALETDERQKIFQISDADKNLAYAVTGIVGDPRGFDLLREIESQVRRISYREFRDCRHYLSVLAENVNEAINDAKRDGKLEKLPETDRVEQSTAWKIATVFVVGYFKKTPCFIQVMFYHFGRASEFSVIPFPSHKYSILSGSDVVRRTMYQAGGQLVLGSPFAQYMKALSETSTLDDAEEYAKGYVQACSTSLARQMDEPKCKITGGHIHVAEITPQGFRWRIAPIVRTSSATTSVT